MHGAFSMWRHALSGASHSFRSRRRRLSIITAADAGQDRCKYPASGIFCMSNGSRFLSNGRPAYTLFRHHCRHSETGESLFNQMVVFPVEFACARAETNGLTYFTQPPIALTYLQRHPKDGSARLPSNDGWLYIFLAEPLISGTKSNK